MPSHLRPLVPAAWASTGHHCPRDCPPGAHRCACSWVLPALEGTNGLQCGGKETEPEWASSANGSQCLLRSSGTKQTSSTPGPAQWPGEWGRNPPPSYSSMTPKEKSRLGIPNSVNPFILQTGKLRPKEAKPLLFMGQGEGRSPQQVMLETQDSHPQWGTGRPLTWRWCPRPASPCPGLC